MQLVKFLFFFTILLIVAGLLKFISWATVGFILAMMIGIVIFGFAIFIIYSSVTKNGNPAH